MPNSTESPELAEPKPNDTAPEMEGRLATILARFPDRFSPEQVNEIRERLIKSIDFGATLSGQHLANGIGPNFDPRAMNSD